MANLIFSLQEFLKVIPGLILLPVSLYLAIKKLRYSVSYSVAFGADLLTPMRITNVVLINNKDRPVPIFAIHVVVNQEFTYEVERFNPPLVLKSLEAISVQTSPYSKLMFGNKEWIPDLAQERERQIEFYLSVPRRMIKCKPANHPDLEALAKFHNVPKATKIANRFNGVVFSDKIRYAITYKARREGAKRQTAFVDVAGTVGGDWDYHINRLSERHLHSREGVWEFIKEAEADHHMVIYGIEDLSKR